MGKVSTTDSRGRSLKAHLYLIAIFAFFIQPLQADQPGKAAIASAHYLATEAGHEVLAKGGNAFDAAVAVSAVLAVVEQTSSGIGGGALWVLHRASDGFETMIDGREMALIQVEFSSNMEERSGMISDFESTSTAMTR